MFASLTSGLFASLTNGRVGERASGRRGEAPCPEGRRYFGVTLPKRRAREAATLANLTGWDIGDIRARMGSPDTGPGEEPWWKRLWER